MTRTPFRDRSPVHKVIWKAVFAMNRTAANVTKAAIVHGVIDLGEDARRRAKTLDTNNPALYG